MKWLKRVLRQLGDIYYYTTMRDGGTGIDLLYGITTFLTVRYLCWSNPWWGDGSMVGYLTVIMLVAQALSALLIFMGWLGLKKRVRKKPVQHDESYSYGEHLPQRPR